MKLTPLDVKKQEFKKTMRGYDPVEVDAFLEMTADELESLIREKNSLNDETLKLKTQLQDYQNVESTLKETLMQAQETVNQSRETSKREADMTVREADIKAEKILEDARRKLADMKNELVLIKAQKDSFARRLRHLLESQMELIGVLELDDMGFEKLEKKSPKVKSRPRNEGRNSNFEQEKIEFEGVEDILPEETLVENTAVKTIRVDRKPEAPETELGQSEKEQANEKEAPEGSSSRISDQLIF